MVFLREDRPSEPGASASFTPLLSWNDMFCPPFDIVFPKLVSINNSPVHATVDRTPELD
jgi:hypothetical protein